MTKKIVHKALYELLKPLASGKLYTSRAPDGAKGPFIIIQKTGGERWRAINGPSGIARVDMQIDAYADTPYGAQALAGEIETILDGYRGIVYHGANSPQDFVRIAGIVLDSDADLFDETDEPFLHRVTATYSVTYDQ
jgi:hypothetical protein